MGAPFWKISQIYMFFLKKEIFENRKQHFPARTDYLFIFFFIQLRLNRCEIHCCRKRIVNQTVKEKKYFDILQLNIYIYIFLPIWCHHPLLLTSKETFWDLLFTVKFILDVLLRKMKL